MPPGPQSSGEIPAGVDPMVMLVIERTVSVAFERVRTEMGIIATKQSSQDVEVERIKGEQRLQDGHIASVQQWMQEHPLNMHQAPALVPAEPTSKKEMHPLLLTLIATAINVPVTGVMIFLLKGAAENAK